MDKQTHKLNCSRGIKQKKNQILTAVSPILCKLVTSPKSNERISVIDNYN